MTNWHNRVRSYEKANWVKDKRLLNKILKACNLEGYEVVCDIGTGTGIIAKHLSNHCYRVLAIDNSKDMIDIAKSKCMRQNNITFLITSIELLDLDKDSKDCMVSRMCFHHIEYPDIAMKHCYDILKPGGKMLICEVIPPYCCLDFYEDICNIKEKRNVFSSDDLVSLFKIAGFKKINFSLHVMKQVSIINWIRSNALVDSKEKMLFYRWKNAPSYVKKSHNLVVTDDDVLVDWLFMIISGVK